MATNHSGECESPFASNTEQIPANSVSSHDRPSSPVDSCVPEEFAPIRTNPSYSQEYPAGAKLDDDDDDIARTASRRRSYASGYDPKGEEWAQIEKLISRMFGSERKANSEEEKTRHIGVVWKNLTVKGVGLGAALQPTNGDIFLGLPRLIKQLFTRGSQGVGTGKTSIRTILDDFTVSRFLIARSQLDSPLDKGCVRPGEMLLVLGRPGSGCSTFLKVLGNQRAGYESIEGDVRYGGTDSKKMAKQYRSEGVCFSLSRWF